MIVVVQFVVMFIDDIGVLLLLVKGGLLLELCWGIFDLWIFKDFDMVVCCDIELIYEQFVDVGEMGWEGFIVIFIVFEEIDVFGMLVKLC